MPREINRKSLQESKFYILRELVANKVIIITEDSIFRGNVCPEVAGMLRSYSS
jgi:glutamine phosphoribosylpyrophosphate amidotransferase